MAYIKKSITVWGTVTDVFLFDTRKEMRFWFRDNPMFFAYEDIKSDVAAFTIPNYESETKISKILFNREDFTEPTIAHECFHCAVHFDNHVNKRKNLPYSKHNSDREEVLAYYLMYLMEKILKKFK